MGSLDFTVLDPYLPAFLSGAILTIYVSVMAFAIGCSAGFFFGIIYWRLGASEFLLIFNDAIRSLPPLVLLFFAYYFPYRSIGISAPGPVAVGIGALAFAQAAYTADLVVSALRNVSKRQIEAARSLGLSASDLWKFVVLPDVYRQLFAPHIAFFIGVVRLSSLIAILGAQDTVYVARIVIAQSFRAIEPWLLVGLIYVVLVVPIAFTARRLEKSKWIRRR